MRKNKKTSGFTLIELLVVIAVISLLSSVVMSSVATTRMKSRDAKRVSDLYQIRTALQLYYDAHGQYPPGGFWQNSFSSPGNWIPQLISEGFIQKLPNDPRNNASGPWATGNYSYVYSSGADVNYQDYNLFTQFEDRSNQNRCELKCWKFNSDGSGRTGQAWCGATSATCSGSQPYSQYLYSDHNVI
jgi:prepilin-type N-terminal cleavage/methylation domain-containing protein